MVAIMTLAYIHNNTLPACTHNRKISDNINQL